MPSDEETLYDTLWHTHFPFEYWYNRLEKINPHNDRERLDALYSLAELSEIYARSFSAILQNPDQPWYYLDELMVVESIEDALKLLQAEADLAIRKASDISGVTNSIDIENDRGISKIDAITVSLLGIPHEFDESGMIELPESPTFHRNICETILEIAEGQKTLKNSFDHGFRVFPVSLDTVQSEMDSSKLIDDKERQAVKRRIEFFREQRSTEQWPLTYFHFNRETTKQGNSVHLYLKHVDAWMCYKLAEMVLDALYNLIAPGPGYRLEAATSDVPVDIIEEDSIVSETLFSIESPTHNDLVRILTKEDIDQNR